MPDACLGNTAPAKTPFEFVCHLSPTGDREQTGVDGWTCTVPYRSLTARRYTGGGSRRRSNPTEHRLATGPLDAAWRAGCQSRLDEPEGKPRSPSRALQLTCHKQRDYIAPMGGSVEDIPELERLARDVLRLVFRVGLGEHWQSELSGAVARSLRRAREVAESQRPDESLRDDWDAAGLPELAQALRSTWSGVEDYLTPVWRSLHEAEVDLMRLREHRGRRLHRIGPEVGLLAEEEVAGIVLRVRVGLEHVRRRMEDEMGEWWPYIESIHSNIPDFCVTRAARNRGRPTLVAGDTVQIEIRGVNPLGDQTNLRYRVSVFGTSRIDLDWSESGHFMFQVPLMRHISVHYYLHDCTDPGNGDEWVSAADVRPQPRS